MNTKQKHLLRNFLLLGLLLLVFAEGSLRVLFWVKNYPVGKLAPAWLAFEPVDTLIEQQSFFTDEHGIYKMKRDFWEQQQYLVNPDNFRGRDFIPDTLNTSEKSVLFIGDSFVWGFHAEPIDSCFADLLDDDTQVTCYNAGIPGTDPAQYAAVAERYVPLLQPDVVCVAIYLANDLMNEPRAVVPNQALWYQTNAGWLPAFYKGIEFSSAQESYNYIMDKYTPKTFWKKAVLKTAIGTAILSLPLRMAEYAEWQTRKTGIITNAYLKQIKAMSDNHQARLLIFIIPAVQTDLTEEFFKDPNVYMKKEYPELTQGLEQETFVLPVKREHYYAPPDGHFNNAGHKTAAEFIRTLLLP